MALGGMHGQKRISPHPHGPLAPRVPGADRETDLEGIH